MKEIVLGVTGSIGAYKAGDLVRRLREQGCVVTCVMTKEAREFVTPLMLQALSERKTYPELFSLEDPHILHTELADRASLVLIAPATANVIGKLANGLADDLLSCVVLATKAPVLLAPAMNVQMYHHPAVQENLKRLRRMGYHVVGPTVGGLACGYEAIGHLAEVEDIVRVAVQLARPPAAGAGPANAAGERPAKSAKPTAAATRRVRRPASRATRRRR